jgi:hypothetical protein
MPRDALETFGRVHRACLDANTDFDRCRQRARDAYDSVPRYQLISANGAFVALAPIPVGWLLAYEALGQPGASLLRLGRVLINAQIAGYAAYAAVTRRLRIFTPTLTVVQRMISQ